MSLAIFISASAGLCVGAGVCYVWREASMQRQLRQVLAVMETPHAREDISLPLISQLRRRAILIQQQQQRLQQQLSGWQSVFQAAPIGYIQLDAENQVLCCNQRARTLLYIQRWDGEKARLLLELVRSYELDRSIQTARSNQVTQQLIWQYHIGYQATAETDSVWLQATSIPLADGAVGVFVESQQAQIEASAARERWLADLAHEIRTPLTSIRLIAETLATKVTPDLTRWADRMLQETNRTIDLVQHFLELSQLETAPSQYLRLEKVNIVDLIYDAWHTIEPVATQHQIELVYRGLQQLVLEIDRARFIQVFINLFDNSIKYCPERGHIWIEIRTINLDRKPGNEVAIDIYDDGDGFTPSDLPYVFDRLYRGDLSRTRQPSNIPNSSISRSTLSATGSGLGLAIVRQIVLAHQGTVTANNHPTTGGAWIQVVLPQHQLS